MADDRDTRFRPKLGKIRARGGKKAKRFIDRILAAANKAGPGRFFGGAKRSGFSGVRIGRGATAGRFGGPGGDALKSFRARRVVIKARIVKLAGSGRGKAQAHLCYVERDGTGRDGAPGRLYDAARDDVERDGFRERCDGDRHQFRFIVSAEDADELADLRPFVRDLMEKMETDLGTKLDWVAVDHFNTDNPHSHVILRGKDERGGDLIIARDYISHGMRRRAAEILTLELGPRSDRDIENAMRREVTKDRFTSIDRQMLRDREDGIIDLRYEPQAGYIRMKRSLRIGRLQKLQRMGLAREVTPGQWRLSEALEPTLRRVGERGDIIKTLHAEMRRQGIDHAAGDYRIYDARAEGAHSITGRIIATGLADEQNDRRYLVVDAVDGQAHYVDIGQNFDADDYRTGAIVEIAPRPASVKAADQVIADVAEANEGIYNAETHARHDPRVSLRFVQAHIRRLEALRRAGYALRMPDGRWAIPENHLDKAAEYEAERARRQPVTVTTLSGWSLERQIPADGATWLDRQLVGSDQPGRAASGFGAEVAAALEKRRAHLIAADLAHEKAGRTVYVRALLRRLRQREIAKAGAKLAAETGLAYQPMEEGSRIEGIYRRRLDLASGRFALVAQAREFTLVPWRSVMERAKGRAVSGLVRGDTISWDISRKRGLSIG